MERKYLLALPVLALIAGVGLASAHPVWSPDDMTAEEKELRVQMLEMRQEMIQSRINYINGVLTEEEFENALQAHMEEMNQIRYQLREMLGDGEGYPCAGGGIMGRGFGHRMMGF